MSGPRRLGSLLGTWNAPARGRAQMTTDAQAAALALAWEQAVGPQVARRSRPAKLAAGALTVLTASSAWSAELALLAPKIVESLRRAVPEAGLRRLRFAVASGRTRLLFEGARHSARARRAEASQDGRESASPLTQVRGEEACAALVERLAATQRSLDEWRDRTGYRACATCGGRFLPRSARERECAPCAAAGRRREDARIERALTQAPWLALEQVRETLPGVRLPAYRRARQRLLTRWQTELEWAERRLRRAAPTAHDRVAAWSYLMAHTGMPERDIGRAVVRDVLGAAWANVLFAR